MQERKEFPNTVVSSGISASWLLNACVMTPEGMYQAESVLKFDMTLCAEQPQ